LSRLLLSAVAVVTAGAGLAVVPSVASAAPTCDTSWLNPGAGGVWNTAGDWTNGVPTSAKIACLGASATPYNVVALGGANAAKGVVISSGATLTLEGEQDDLDVALTVGSGGITNAGTIEMTSVGTVQDATLTVTSGAKLVNSGLLQADAGAGGNRFVNAAVGNTGNINANTNVVMNAALSNNTANNGADVGTITVAANQLLYAPSLTNYSATTHTLTGGNYDLGGTFAVPGLDVRTLNANVSLVTPAAELQNAPDTDALLHLATLTQSFSNRLLITGSLTVGALTIGSQLEVGPNATLTSTAAITTTAPDGQLVMDGGTVKSSQPLINHGAIDGSGTINGSLQSDGFLLPQSDLAFGQLTVTGNFTQMKAGEFAVEWDGTFKTTPLHVNGTATVAGTLFLSQFGTAGSSFTLPLINATKRTGTFGETSFVVFTDGSRPLPTYSSNGVSLIATTTLQQDDLRVGYQGWTGAPNVDSAGSYTRNSFTPGDAISYTFTSTTVTVVFSDGPDRGKAQVTIDGKSKGVVDTYQSSASGFNSTTYRGLKNVKHTVTVTVTGTKNALSSDSTISVTGFRTSILHDLAAPGVSIPGWKTTASAAAMFGTYVSATAAGKRVTVPFSGTGIDWVTQTCKACGQASVVVDGGAPTKIDLFSATTVPQVAEPFRNLAAGNHTITITVLGKKRAAATGTAVAVDAFVVHP
jgi:hypothetical protein